MKKFQARKEDFVCQHCGFLVKGSGYTNHCPRCLWSKHVDINPGDRLNPCQGMMEPSSIEIREGEKILIAKCIVCGEEKKNKISEGDNPEKILEIINRKNNKILYG